MSSPHSADIFIQGEKLSVDVAAIEKELTALWQEVAVDQDAEQTADAQSENQRAVMRACTLNLVVIAYDDHTADRAVNAIAEFTSRHPCRAIVTIVDAEAEKDELSAYVSAHCHLPVAGAKQVCCEQISVIARGQTVHEVPGTVLPLLIGDLPVVLWWRHGLPQDSAIFERLLGASDHLIFDSATGQDLGVTFATANALHANWKFGFVIDLNWLRLTGWREMISQFFELPDLAESVRGITHVILAMARTTEELELSQPALLIGWLAAQLNWRLNEPFAATENGLRALWQAENGEITTEILTEELPEPGLARVSLIVQHNQQQTEFLIACIPGENGATLQATISGFGQRVQEAPAHVRPFNENSLAALMARALDRNQRDEIYEKALRKATQLL